MIRLVGQGHNMPLHGLLMGMTTRYTRWLPLPIHLLCLVFVILLMIKLQYLDSLSWVTVFIFLFLSDFLNIYSKSYNIQKERRLMENAGNNQQHFKENLIRHSSALVDAIGGFLGKLGILLYLIFKPAFPKNDISFTLVNCLIPLFISVFFSVLLKLYVGPPRILGNTNISYESRWIAYAHPLLVIAYRGLQPLLISLQIDGAIRVKWSVIFIPLWILIFGGIGIAIVLITCAPYIHRSSPLPILRESAFALVFIYCAQMIFASSCILIFLVYLVQDLEYEYNFGDGKRVEVWQILSPLIVLFSLLIIIHPFMLLTMDRYQLSLTYLAQVHANLAQVFMNQLSMQEIVLESTGERTWFKQLNSSMYRKLPNEDSILSLLPSNYQSVMSGESAPTEGRDNAELVIAEDGVGGVETAVEDTINLIRVCRNAYLHRSDAVTAPHSRDIEMNAITTRVSNTVEHDNEDASYDDVLSPSGNSSPSSHLINHSISNLPFFNMKPIPRETVPTNDEPQEPCVVCFAKEADAILLECGHAVLCWSCAQEVAKSQRSKCPICRLPIEQLFKISSSPSYVMEDGKLVIMSEYGYRVVSRPLIHSRGYHITVNGPEGVQLVRTQREEHTPVDNTRLLDEGSANSIVSRSTTPRADPSSEIGFQTP